LKCDYCHREIDVENGVWYTNENDSSNSHPICYFGFIGGNKLNLDWFEKLD